MPSFPRSLSFLKKEKNTNSTSNGKTDSSTRHQSRQIRREQNGFSLAKTAAQRCQLVIRQADFVLLFRYVHEETSPVLDTVSVPVSQSSASPSSVD